MELCYYTILLLYKLSIYLYYTMKTNINVTVDTEVLLALKSRKVNISGTINDILSQYLEIKQDTNPIETKKKILEALKENMEKEIEEEMKIEETAKEEAERLWKAGAKTRAIQEWQEKNKGWGNSRQKDEDGS